jgi:1-acyl-sn-glycerol-3-phosphate acyltransferase
VIAEGHVGAPPTVPEPAADSGPPDPRKSPRPSDLIGKVMGWRVQQAAEPTDPDERFLKVNGAVWDVLSQYYFRLETHGWERIPDRTSLLIGVHSGGTLTMDAWTLVTAWQRHFGPERVLHGTAHDVLLTLPGLGDYFRAAGVVAASRGSVGAALAKGDDVIVWPGGEKDAMRSWRKRDTAVLGGRTGFVRQAIRSGVPIVPVATVGGHDTVFVLSEGKWLADAVDRATGMGLKKKLRGPHLPIIAGFPFPLVVEVLPVHLPLPAKIRIEFLDPIEVDSDPERSTDHEYVQGMYDEVQAAIQAGMKRLAAQRRFPVFG